MSIVNRIKSYFTLVKGRELFTDVVSGGVVFEYTDCYGNKFMKDGRWSLFSVKIEGL